MGKREDFHLPIVSAHIEAQLGRPLSRVPPGSEPSPDLESCDGIAPSIAIEVKELIPSEFLDTAAAVSRHHGLDSTLLSLRWGVIVMEDTLSCRLTPMPRFPDDPPQHEIAELAAAGFHVVTRATREDQWRREHTLARRQQLKIKGLANDIEPHLAVLERYGIRETGSYELPSTSMENYQAANEALWEVVRRTRGSLCLARDPIAGEQPGIDLHFGYGSVRTGSADVLARRIQLWLDSDASANLVGSLRRSEADERHGALWLSTEAEERSASEQGVDFRPSDPLNLPDDVDVLWVFVGSIAPRFDGAWTGALVESRG